eukprot:9202000-Prorocentrum_lima.AAC.1
MAAPMMQPGVVTIMASPTGQGQVPALTAPTGQTTDQPMETPLNTSWEFSGYGQLPVSSITPQAFT